MKIFHDLIPTLQFYIEHYGSLGVFIASIIEELIPPIPSAVVQGMGGLLIMMNEPFSFFGLIKLTLLVSIPAALGVCIGSLPYVYLANKYGVEIIERYGKFLGTSVEDLKKFEARLEKNNKDEYIFVAVRAFPAVPAIVLAIYAGIVEMSFWKYFYLSFIGIMIRATVLGSTGWLLGNKFLTDITGFIDTMEKVVVLAIVTAVVYFIYQRKQKKLGK